MAYWRSFARRVFALVLSLAVALIAAACRGSDSPGY
jgi:hypothetical protein